MTISVNIYRNPLSPEQREQRGVQPPVTLRDLTIHANGGASEWPFPTVALVNGEAWKRGRWNEPLTDGMVVEFRSMLRGGGSPVGRARTYASNIVGNARNDPRGFATTAMGLAYGGGGALAGGLLTALTTGMGSATGLGLGAAAFYSIHKDTLNQLVNGMPGAPAMPSALEGESGSPSYGTNTANRRRVGEPIPVVYGQFRVHPDNIEDPLVYIGSTSVTAGFDSVVNVKYQLLCIGHGTFDINGEYWAGLINRPTITGVSGTNRATISSTSVIALNGPKNQDLTTSYTDANASVTIKAGITYQNGSVNVVFPNGLFDATSGSLANRSVDIKILVEEYNGVTLVNSNETTHTLTAATRKQSGALLYSTVNWTPTAGNTLKISAKRASSESTNLNIVEKCTFSSAYLVFDPYTTSGKTLLRIEDIIGGAGQSSDIGDYSVIVTRRLSAYDTGTDTWGTAAATRSIAWALADILKNADYGMGLDDSQIDLDTLAALDTVWDGRGDYFDGVFDQTITAWEALQKVARCGRAIPVLVNGKVTFVRDGVKSVRAAIFNPSNILPGSLKIDYNFRQESEPDGIELAYVDSTTWQEAIVTVAMPGVVGDPERPQKVNLFGCTDEDQATREATYLARRMAYMRKTITWQTEMDGRLLMVGDMVALSHDVPSWSQSGEVIGFTDNGATCDYLTSQALDWSAVGTKYVLLKKQDGSVSGPHTATQITGGFRINDPAWVPNSTLENGERTTFVFYVGSSYDVVITDISPSGDTVCTITAVPYDSRIHDTGA